MQRRPDTAVREASGAKRGTHDVVMCQNRRLVEISMINNKAFNTEAHQPFLVTAAKDYQ